MLGLESSAFDQSKVRWKWIKY